MKYFITTSVILLMTNIILGQEFSIARLIMEEVETGIVTHPAYQIY
ncbi:MAG: hypothetical protein CM1200mP10_25430 [Candidatus Neomarinimicrobiota bacterium]|nr:MAG: hypothetical protein CM1200mP10_25430 [Candidatus Neomarinimicrobiota bacterium]